MTNLGNNVFACDTLLQAKEVMNPVNVMKGIKPVNSDPGTMQPRSLEEPKTIKIPSEMFLDFSEVDNTNEELFDLLSLTVIVNYLKKVCLKQDLGFSD